MSYPVVPVEAPHTTVNMPLYSALAAGVVMLNVPGLNDCA